MDGNVRNETSTSAGSGSPPSEAWLFPQAILGKPVTSPSRAKAEARAEREQLEWLAQISPRHADQLRRLRSAEAADLVKEGAASFQRQLIKGDLASEYQNEIRVWLEELD